VDGVGDLPEVGPGETKSEYATEPQTMLQKDLRGDCESVTAHQAANHTDELVDMISHIPDGGDRSEIPDEKQPSSGYYNSYSRLQSDAPAVAITSNMYEPSSARCIHPFQDHGLTPREAARSRRSRTPTTLRGHSGSSGSRSATPCRHTLPNQSATIFDE